jgi:hypothetical protein
LKKEQIFGFVNKFTLKHEIVFDRPPKIIKTVAFRGLISLQILHQQRLLSALALDIKGYLSFNDDNNKASDLMLSSS